MERQEGEEVQLVVSCTYGEWLILEEGRKIHSCVGLVMGIGISMGMGVGIDIGMRKVIGKGICQPTHSFSFNPLGSVEVA